MAAKKEAAANEQQATTQATPAAEADANHIAAAVRQDKQDKQDKKC